MSGNWVINSGITISDNYNSIPCSSDYPSLVINGDTIRIVHQFTPVQGEGLGGEICYNTTHLFVNVGGTWKKILLQDL